jgi:PAS domain S-box-containing protein
VTSDKSIHAAPPRLHFSVAPEPSRLRRARERIRDYVTLHCADDTVVNDVVLAIEEACTNAIRHSGSHNEIEIYLAFEDDQLRAAVKDDGRGFDVAAFDPERRPDPGLDHGRGLFLISQLCDEMELSCDGGLEVRLVKRNVVVPTNVEASLSDAVEPSVPPAYHGESRQRTFLEEIDELFAALDWEFRYLYVNERFCQITGRPRDELLGKTLWELFPEILGTDVEQRLLEAMHLGLSSRYEFYFPPLESWFEQRLYPTAYGINQFSIEITERKLKELDRDRLLEALRESEERQAFLFKHAPAAIYELDYRGPRFISVNDSTCEYTGYSREELLEMNPLDLLSGQDQALFRDRIRATLAGEPTDPEAEYRVVTKQGDVRYALLNASPIFEDDQPIGAFVVAHDVTERKKAEEALREAEAKAADLIRYAPTGIYEIDFSGPRFTTVNDAMCAMSGYSRDELLAMDPFDLLDAQGRTVFAERIRRARAGGPMTDSVEYRFKTKDGRLRDVVVNTSFTDTGGVIDGALVVGYDITERKLAEQEREALVEELSQSNERARSLADVVEHADVAFAVREPDGRLLMFNQAFVELTGYGREELEEGSSTLAVELTPTDWWEAESPMLAEAVAARRAVRYEKEYVRKDGSRVPIEVFAQPVLDGAGALLHYRSFLTDITERKEAEKALRESEERFRSLFESTIEGIALHEVVYSDGRAVDYRIIEANPAFESQTGVRAQDACGRLASELYGAGEAPYLADYARVAEGGEPYTFETYFAPMERHFRIAVTSPARGRFATLFEDITERKVREHLSAALNEIAASVAAMLDYDEILTRVVGQTGAALGAESSAISSLTDSDLVPTHLWRLPPESLGVPIPRSRTPYVDIAAASRQVVAVDDCETDPRVDLRLQHEWGVRSVMAVPLLVRDAVVGAMFFNYHSREHRFTPLETDFARKAAAVVSGALENARLYEEQQRIAETLQENFIHELPAVAGLEFGVAAKAAFAAELIGGDFSDAFALDDSHVVILIGDVAGKGVRAAGYTETVRSKARAFASIDPTPAFILGKTNELMVKLDPDEPHVTAFCAVLDPRTGHLSYASAGHPAPVHLGPFDCRLLDVRFGPPLGSFERPYAESHAMLTLEDCLVFYTDGVTEARRETKLFGEARLIEAVTALHGLSAQELADGLLRTVETYAGRLADDIQIVTVRLD